MSVEPVTITITVEEVDFGSDLDAMARKKAADELGLDENQIVCVSRAPIVTTGAEAHTDPETGDSQITKLGTLTMTSTWAPAFVAQKRTVTPVAWPDIKLGRGSRWNGMIPDPNDHSKAIEATLISDGEKLIHMDSPEGMAIIRDLGHKFGSGGEPVG